MCPSRQNNQFADGGGRRSAQPRESPERRLSTAASPPPAPCPALCTLLYIITFHFFRLPFPVYFYLPFHPFPDVRIWILVPAPFLCLALRSLLLLLSISLIFFAFYFQFFFLSFVFHLFPNARIWKSTKHELSRSILPCPCASRFAPFFLFCYFEPRALGVRPWDGCTSRIK